MHQEKIILNQLFEGLRPAKIANYNQLPVEVVTEKITKAIKERRIRRSQVLATLEKRWQDEIAPWFPWWQKKPQSTSPEVIHKMLKDTCSNDFDLEIEEIRLYLFCLQRGFSDGELYELLCEIERTLHTQIRTILTDEHGAQETGWWRKGVPPGIRQQCVSLREKDDGEDVAQSPPYNYTTLGQLTEILTCSANIFKNRLPPLANGKPPNMEGLKVELAKLLKIRNKVMHPIGTVPPTEEEFFIVRELHEKFALTKWRPR